MAYIEVDVEMGDFDTYELAHELLKRIKKDYVPTRFKLTDKQKAELKDALHELAVTLGETLEQSVPIKSLDYKIKLEHLIKVWGKYNASDFENKLP